MLSIRGSQLTSPSPSSLTSSNNNLLTMKRSQSLDFDSIQQQRNANTQKNVLLLEEDCCYKENKNAVHSEQDHVVIGASRFSREYFFSNM